MFYVCSNVATVVETNMLRKRVSDLGPLEFLLLTALWELGKGTAGEILTAHNSTAKRPLAYTTISTALGRMEEKGVLQVDKSRQPYLFRPLVTRDQLLRQRVKDFVQTFFRGEPIDLAVRLVEDHPLTEESLDQLELVLRTHKSNRRKNARKSVK